MGGNVKLLDCTIRDGGYALEGILESNIDAKGFNQDAIHLLSKSISQTNVDVVEIGRVDYPCHRNGLMSAAYDSVEKVSQNIPRTHMKNQLFSFMFRGPDMPLEMIPDYREGLCDIIRVCIRYSEFEKSLDYAEALIKKGYKVSIQGAVTMRYSADDRKMLFDRANKMGAYAVYIVDTYGYMNSEDVEFLYHEYNNNLNKDIILGFHAHNNLDSAFMNVKSFLKCAQDTKRDILIDSCCMGMGQSAGNMQTEILAPYLNRYYDKDYDFIKIMRVCDIIEDMFWHENIWGYSMANVIAATYRIAYGYSIALRREFGMTSEETADILRHVPNELAHRYTKENLDIVVRNSNYNGDKYVESM